MRNYNRMSLASARYGVSMDRTRGLESIQIDEGDQYHKSLIRILLGVITVNFSRSFS